MTCLVWGILDSVTAQHLSKILCTTHYLLRLTEPDAVIIIRQLCLCGGKLVYFEGDFVALQTIPWYSCVEVDPLNAANAQRSRQPTCSTSAQTLEYLLLPKRFLKLVLKLVRKLISYKIFSVGNLTSFQVTSSQGACSAKQLKERLFAIHLSNLSRWQWHPSLYQFSKIAWFGKS